MYSLRANAILSVAIVFAAIVIGGSLVFFGTQLSGSGKASVLDDESFAEAIEKYIANQNRPPEAGEVKPVSDRDYIRGNPDAEISLIEYSDFECPFCKKSFPTVKQLIDEYPGQVNWVYRHFPLDFHDPLATKQAEAVECAGELAGNDAFWTLHDLIFETTTSNGRGMEIADLSTLAVRAGVNQSEFDTCMGSERFKNFVSQNIAEGSKAGVQGTPGNILINNKTGEKKLISGAQPLGSFKAAVDELLE